MSSTLKFIPFLLAPLSTAIAAQDIETSDPAGFFIGGGLFAASNSDCNSCDYTGSYAEIGYDFNQVVGIEAKLAKGDGDNDFELSIGYIGLNIGHDFNTDWFRLYGKVGYANIEETVSVEDYWCSYYGCYDSSYSYEFTSKGITAGIGARFTFSGRASGLYAKVESVAISFSDDSVSAALIAGLGYRF